MRNAPKTRPSLILRLRNREDLDAWQEFAEIYQPLVYRLASRKGFQDSDAADLSQEVLLRVANAVERWDPDEARGSFRGWLFTISRNLMITFLDKQGRRPISGGADQVVDLVNNQPDPNSLESQMFDEELERQVFAWASLRIKKTFQESTWEAFWQTAVAGDSATDVAKRLQISVGAVYVARSRVIQRLRSEVTRVMNEKQSGESS